MAMSVCFSVVFYRTSARELELYRPTTVRMPASIIFSDQGQADESLRLYLQQRAQEGRRHLLTNLVLVNVLTLAVGSYVSYMLARRTLEPIEAAMETQSRFTSDASHELRTPLAAIQAENEVALRSGKLTLPRAKALLQSNLEEAVALRTLADSLLQLSRAEHSEVTLQPVSLSEVTTEALNRVVRPAQAKGITVADTVTDTLVLADSPLLEEAVVVLLDNAIKYSPRNSTVQLTTELSGKQVLVRVSDHGPGITATDQRHIFERFYRADQSRSKQQIQGYGLGLSLAKKIMQQHGGSIAVDSAPGKGAVFTLHIRQADSLATSPAHP
jgi:signal transduction histidine kinase